MNEIDMLPDPESTTKVVAGAFGNADTLLFTLLAAKVSARYRT
jgi:hypothetical protein